MTPFQTYISLLIKLHLLMRSFLANEEKQDFIRDQQNLDPILDQMDIPCGRGSNIPNELVMTAQEKVIVGQISALLYDCPYDTIEETTDYVNHYLKMKTFW